MLEKTLQSLLDHKEIKPVYPKGIQSWIFIGRTDARASIFWPPDAKCLLTGKDPNAGKDWKQKEKTAKEDEMVSIIDSMDMNLNMPQEIVEDREAYCAAVCEVTRIQTWLSDRITTATCDSSLISSLALLSYFVNQRLNLYAPWEH